MYRILIILTFTLIYKSKSNHLRLKKIEILKKKKIRNCQNYKMK